jgi:paraquat-inducible protein B
MEIENTNPVNPETNNETDKPTYVTKDELMAMFSQYKEESAGMVSGAVNRALKANKTLEDNFNQFQQNLTEQLASLIGQKTETESQQPETTEKIDPQILEMRKQLELLRAENQRKEEEANAFRKEQIRLQSEQRFYEKLRDKVTNPKHLLSALKVDNIATEKDGSLVFETTNQWGETETIPLEDKLDDILGKEEYQFYLKSRPGNGLNSTQPSQQSPRGNYLANELPLNLLNNPNFIDELSK